MSVDRFYGLTGNLGVKAPVRVATTANITLSGLQTIDGVTLVADDSVLVKDQTNTVDNGVYLVSATAWTRRADFDGSRDIVKGTLVYTSEGNTNQFKFYAVNSSDVEIGTDTLTFLEISPQVTGFDVITADTTYAVPADFATPLAAMNYLMDFIIMPGVAITITLSAGSYTHTGPLPRHPQSNQITITGPAVTFPVAADFVITGNDAPSRATDNANHLIMLKAKFGAEIYCSNTKALDSTYGDGVPTLNNLLFWTDNTTSLAAQIYNCVTYFNNISFHGWDGIGIALVNGGHIRANGLTLSGMGDDAVQFSDGGELKSIGTFISASNAISGAFGKRGGVAEIAGAVCKGNGEDGLLVQDDAILEAPSAVLTGNGGNGGATGLGGVLNVVGATITGNDDYGLLAENAGLIIATSANTSSNGAGGMLAEGLGEILAGSSQSNTNTGAGYFARELGRIFCENSSASTNTSHNYFAQNGGRVSAFNSDSVAAGGSGVRAEGTGSFIDIRSGSATTSTANGLYAVFGGEINAGSFSTTSNTGAGARIDEGGRIFFQSGTCTGNGSRGLYVVSGGYIDAESATVSGNTGNEIQVDTDGTIRIVSVTGLVDADVSGNWNKTSSYVTALPSGFQRFTPISTLTISSGAVTATGSYHAIDTESAAATDDLDTINGVPAGALLFLQSANSGRDATAKDGTGNLKLNGDFVFTNTDDLLTLLSDGTNLREVSRSDNA